MLVQLAIRDIVLIERLDIGFAAGLSVLTGETGAGKSILLDAFALALGGRGDGGLVRHGEAKGQVTAVFDVAAAHPARALAQRARHPRRRRPHPAARAVRRRAHPRLRQRPAGQRRRCCAPSARSSSRSTASTTTGRWSTPAAHRALLDAFGGCDGAAVAAAHRTLRDARLALAEHRERIAEGAPRDGLPHPCRRRARASSRPSSARRRSLPPAASA